jgi:hypothetical protein
LRINRKKTAIAAGSAILVGAMGYYGINLGSKLSEERENKASGYAGQLRIDETQAIKRIINNQNSQARSLGANEDKYVNQVLGEANWAAVELRIPRPFIVAQWLMETGNLEDRYRVYNNLGGIQLQVSPEKSVLKRYGDLHSFGKEYVKILRKDGATNSANFGFLIDRLYVGHYFYRPTTRDGYANAVAYQLRMIENTGSEYKRLAIAVQSGPGRQAQQQTQITQRQDTKPAESIRLRSDNPVEEKQTAENPFAVWPGMSAEQYQTVMRNRYLSARNVGKLTRGLGEQKKEQQIPKPKMVAHNQKNNNHPNTQFNNHQGKAPPYRRIVRVPLPPVYRMQQQILMLRR